MHKRIIAFLIGYMAFAPLMAAASPGQLDQYGGHACEVDCETVWDLSAEEYHYHVVPTEPDYLQGHNVREKFLQVYIPAEVPAEKRTNEPDTLLVDPLKKDAEADAEYCPGGVFASGRYDLNGMVRVEPVCISYEIDLEVEKKNGMYQELPVIEGAPATKAYHMEIHEDGKKVFTSHPKLEELSGRLIQGETDTQIYYINPNDLEMGLRPVAPAYASVVGGDNWEDKIVYFDDGIINSFPRGSELR